MQVYIDGVSVPLTPGTNFITGLTRSDLPAAFPGLCDSDKALAVYYLNASALGLTSGLHTLLWGITDDGGQSEGIGSRYFTLLASGTDQRTAQRVTGAVGTIPAPSADAPPVSLGPTTSLAGLWPTLSAIRARVGPDGAPFETAVPEGAGGVQIALPATGRLTLDLTGAVDRGYEVVGDTLRALPIGSTLDAAGGRFYWTPPVGAGGTFTLVFVRGTERINVHVTLVAGR